MWCLGHARSTRFDGECQFHVPRYDAESLAAMQNTGRFWPAWFASYKDYADSPRGNFMMDRSGIGQPSSGFYNQVGACKNGMVDGASKHCKE